MRSSCCSTLCRDNRRVSRSRARTASSGVSLDRLCAGLSKASDCCASTDLLSHPLAISLIIVRGTETGLWRFPGASSPGIWLVITKMEQHANLMWSVDGIGKKLGRQLRQETKRLHMLTDVTSLLSSNWDVAQVFPKVSARLRRVLYQEFATFALHDAGTGLLVYQATDFPLGKGLMPTVQVSPSETPVGRSMRERKPMIFSKEQLQGFDDEVAKGLGRGTSIPLLCATPAPEGGFRSGGSRKHAPGSIPDRGCRTN